MNSLPSFQACIQIQKLPFNAMIISSLNEELLHPIKSLGEACGISIQLDHSKLDVVSTEALLWANDQTKPNSRIQCLKFKLSVCTFKKLFDLGTTWLGCPILSSRTTVQRISRALETAGSKSSVGKGNLLPTWLSNLPVDLHLQLAGHSVCSTFDVSGRQTRGPQKAVAHPDHHHSTRPQH